MRKDDPTFSMIVGGLWLVLFLLPAGCAPRDMASPQVGFQPAGHDNEFKVAESMRIGDKGRDIDKSSTITTVTPIRGERVTVNTVPTNALICAGVALALFLLFMAWAINRLLVYRNCVQILQQAVADEGDGALIEKIKPRIRAMGRRQKRIFDKVLLEVAHG